MIRSEYHIPLMDCPSEENMIRIKLAEIQSIKALDFDLANRTLVVFHEGQNDPITDAIESLELKGKLVDSSQSKGPDLESNSSQRRLLWIVLAINFAFFLIESATGLISGSMGLVADSLDMLADAFVYGISLLAVGAGVSRKKKVARIAGYFQIMLAIVGFVEVIRRFISGSEMPDFQFMISISVLALIANGYCLYLLKGSSSKDEAHMQASMIFTSNDVIINLGVILAGVLVLLTQSGIPDLVVGSIVFVLVVKGAIRILALGK